MKADDSAPLGAMATHDHKPIVVRSKPVIERLPVKVIEPVDLKLSNRGHVFVADRKAECVFQLNSEGDVSLVCEQLPNIERIQVAADHSVYVLTATGGESSLHQITSSGRHMVMETFEFPAKSFVRDNVGQFYLSVKQSGRIMSLSSEGEVTQLTELSQPAVDMTLNAGGQLEVLLGSGQIARVNSEGHPKITGYAPIGSTRLTSLEDGSLLALSNTGNERAQVVHVSREPDRPEQFKLAANVPAGTRAVGFDSLGNLCLANPDLRAVTKVTSQFQIACPHCGKPTRMIFSAEPDPAADAKSRSF